MSQNLILEKLREQDGFPKQDIEYVTSEQMKDSDDQVQVHGGANSSSKDCGSIKIQNEEWYPSKSSKSIVHNSHFELAWSK